MAGVRDKNVFSFLKSKSNKRERNIVQVDRSHRDSDNASETSQKTKDCRQKRVTPERRESGRFQSAARILRSLGRGDESHKHRGKENVSSGMDRKNPQYHSEGKGLRKKSPNKDPISGSSKERSHSFCEKETQRRISVDAFSCESPILELPSASNSPKVNRNKQMLNSSKLSEIHIHELNQEPVNSENIYEHVSNPSEEAGENINTFELDASTAKLMVPAAFEREKERRSARKLTKDSGYETSPYSESDYANLEHNGEDTCRPNITKEFRVNSSMSVIQTCSLAATSDICSKENFEKLPCCAFPEARNNSEILKQSSFTNTTPAAYPESISSGLSTSRSRSSLPKYPSVESLDVLPEALVSQPPFAPSLVSARSTPSLCHLAVPNKIPYKEVKHGSKLPNSKSTPNLEGRKNESMVTNRYLMNPLGHTNDSSPHNGQLLPPEMYYDRDLSRKESLGQSDYANHLRSSSYQILHSRQSSNGYHARQYSNESACSDDTIKDVSLSQSYNSSGRQYQYPVSPEANYFVQWDHQCHELGYSPQPESSFYTSSKVNSTPSRRSTFTDHNASADKFTNSPSKLLMSPPPPPVRDASSLKYVRYGPGHEKFPSWPVPAGSVSQVLPSQHIHDATLSIIQDPSFLGLPQGCHRSHSWTEQSDYPKNNSGEYTRPHLKNQCNPNFQSQLLTVMENCEKLPPEMFLSKHPEELLQNHGDIQFQDYNSESMVYCPPYDREGRPIDDKDYNIPSPPERDPGMGDINLCHFTSAQLEEHARLYDLNYEEFPHITPFLDQLRQESYTWDEHSERDSGRGESESVADSSRYSNGRESVTTIVTNSSSASSSETLKWHGSFSDISEVSGNSRETKLDPNVAHSSRVKAPQRHNSESVLYYETDVRRRHPMLESKMSRERHKIYRDTESGYLRSNKEGKLTREMEKNDCNTNLKKFPSYSYSQPLSQINESPAAESSEDNNLPSFRCPKSPTIDFSKPPSVADRISELEKHSRSVVNIEENKSPVITTATCDRQIYPEKRKQSFSSNGNNPTMTVDDVNQVNSNARHDQEQSHSRALMMPTRRLSMTRRDVHDLPVSPDKYVISAMEMSPINSPYTYLDPNKKCMVHDSTLKNIQKQALLSFYERKTGKGSNPTSYKDSPTSHTINSDNGSLSAPNMRSEGHNHSSENMARLGKVPPDNEASPKLRCKNSFKKCDITNMDIGTSNAKIDLSTCPQYTLPQIHSNQVMDGLSPDLNSSVVAASDHHNPSVNDYDNESRDQYISHSPSSSNLQLKCDNVQSALPILDASIRPPDRPPKKPSLRSNYAGKSFDESEASNGEYKNIQRKAYYYKKPPAPDPPPTPTDEVSQLLPILNEVKNEFSRALTPELPPPPPPPVEDDPVLMCDEPLPPPPSDITFEGLNQETICEENDPERDKAYHKDSYMAHRKDWTTGFEGRYRRTHSPSAPAQRNLQLTRPRDHESSMNIRNLQRSGVPSKILPTSNGASIHMRSSVSTSNLGPVNDVSRDNDVINNNLCQTSRNLAQSADWSSHNTSITVTFSSEELKAFKAKKASLQLSTLRKYNAKDTRHHNPRDVGGSVQSLASSSEASQSSTPSDESRLSSSWKTSLDSLNRPPSGMSDFSCHMRPISRAISVGDPLQRVESQNLVNRSPTIAEPLRIITTTNESNNNSNSSPISLHHLSISREMPVSHDGPVTAHPATVTEDTSQPSSPVSLRDQMNATSTPKPSPDNSPKSSPSFVNSSGFPLSLLSQSPVRSFKDSHQSPLSSSVPNASNLTISPNSSASYVLPSDQNLGISRATTSPSYLKLLSPTGTSCSMAALVVPEDQSIDRSNIVTLGYGRTVSKEEVDYEKMSFEIMSSCICDKQLKTILAPSKSHKTIASYMQNLFSLELRKDLLCSNHLKHPDLRVNDKLLSIGVKYNANNIRASIPIDSTHLSVSDCKARLLAKVNSSSMSSLGQSRAMRKESLTKCLTTKLKSLREEQEAVKREISANGDLGLRVTDMIQSRAKTAELNRYKLHVEEIDKIISLLLVLSGRLARAENSLLYFTESSSDLEKKTLETKRDKLKEQLDEAKKLKESIDRRAIQVSKFLMQYMNENEFAEYDHYVKMKAKMFMDSRELDEKVRIGEEQLQTLLAASL